MSLVSIVIPAYNSAATLGETLDACRAQRHTPIEIIVVDDGSSDETVQIAERYGVRLIQQANQGPAIARNTGIAAAKGDYIQFCDSDDVLHPEKIARSMALIESRPDVALVYCRMQSIDEEGRILTDAALVPPEDYFGEEWLFCRILKANGSPIQTSTILVRKAALEAVGVYRADPTHRCAEDWDLLLRLAQNYPFLGIPEVMLNYRHTAGSLTTKPLLMAQGRLQTVIYARDYKARPNCMNDEVYNRFEAARYHVLAMAYWQEAQRQEARRAFLKAAALSPKGALSRRVYAVLSFIFPVSITHLTNRLLKRRL
jgi:glycosyltransferase involved in cell wall biosynthesis